MNLPDSVSNTSYIADPEEPGRPSEAHLPASIYSTSVANGSELVANRTSSKTTMRASHRQPYMEKTTDFYDTYDPSVGVRTAAALGAFLFFIIGYSLYKTKCRRNRWSQDDKEFIERYSKLLADKWSGKAPPPPPARRKSVAPSKREHTSLRSSKCSIANTAEWVQSQPLHEVSMLQDTMYKICMESFKATACQVCSLSDLRGPTNLLMKPPIRDSYLKVNSSLDYSPDSGADTGPHTTHIPPSGGLQHMDSIDIDLRLPFPKSRSLDEKMHSSLMTSFHREKPYMYSKLPDPPNPPASEVQGEETEARECPMATPDSTETLSRQADSSGKSHSCSATSPDLFSPMTIEASSDSDSLDYCYDVSYVPTARPRPRASLKRQASLDSNCEFARFMDERGQERTTGQPEAALLPHQQICIPEIHNHDDHSSQSSSSLTSSVTSEERSASQGSGDRANQILCIPEIRISCDSLHKTQARGLLTADILHAQLSKSADRLNKLISDRKSDMLNGDVIISLRDLKRQDSADRQDPALVESYT